MLKAVLFDMDQTLVDWESVEPWDAYQFRRMTNVFEFTHTHLSKLDHLDADQFFDAYLLALSGAWNRSSVTLQAPDMADILTATLRACGVPEDKIDKGALMRIYDWQAPMGERAYPDVFEVLPQLQAHHLALGIVTNSSHPMTYRDRELRAIGLFDWFPTCRVSAVDVGYLKPHRRIFEYALEVIGVQADETVFVGDSLHADIGGAQSVGMLAVQRLNPTAPDDNENDTNGSREIVPDGTISTLHDLLPLLDRWYPDWRNGHA